MCRARAAQGFTLVELILAALLGCLLCGVVVQLLFAETRQGGALAESLQLKQWQRRMLELLKSDLGAAPAGSLTLMVQKVGPVAWPVDKPNSPSRQQMALILSCTAWVRPHRRSGAVMC